MEVIKLKDRIIYRADVGKRVHYTNDYKHFYSEIVVKKETDQIEEVEVIE